MQKRVMQKKVLVAVSGLFFIFSPVIAMAEATSAENRAEFIMQGFTEEEIREAEEKAYAAANASRDKSIISSESRVDWTKHAFVSDISMNVVKAGIPMPSGKSLAVNRIKMELPILVKDPLLSLYVDDTRTIEDLVREGTLTLEALTHIIDKSKQTPAYFHNGTNNLKTTNTINLQDIGKLIIKHRKPYVQDLPIDRIASRPYTGIIIDARGVLPIQGEFTNSSVSPCLFPRIWDENMTLVYERNMVEPETAKTSGIVEYMTATGPRGSTERAGKDPLWIMAKKVYGVNRCDPVISYDDYLRIATVPQNRELLKNGKVVILLGEKEISHAVTAPERNTKYYLDYTKIQKELEKERDTVPNITLEDSPTGGMELTLTISDLRFIADSTELLPEERPRVSLIAKQIKDALANGGNYSIIVEGHTADVNKPNGQMTLSIQRAQAVIEALKQDGIDGKLFSYKGYGGTKPVESNNTAAGRAKNRRVVIKLLPQNADAQRR